VTIKLAGTNILSSDFTGLTSLQKMLTFTSGSLNISADIIVADDNYFEADEDLTITLISPSRGTINSVGNGVDIRIESDEIAPSFALTENTVSEQDPSLVTKLTLAAGSSEVETNFDFWVEAASGGGSGVKATNNVDFTKYSTRQKKNL
jgi:hypothetical protein